MSFPDKPVLRKHELDAIIATAMDPQLTNSECNQELAVSILVDYKARAYYTIFY